MEGTFEETGQLEERRSLVNNQQEGLPVADVFTSFEIMEEKSGSCRTLSGRTFGRVHHCLLIIGLCSILGIVWLGWRYGKIEAIWSLWRDENSEYDFQSLSSVSISIVKRAVEKGAVCLDGSPPAYFLHRGAGDGANNWLLFHEGGAWCQNDDDCLQRSYTTLGSSRKMPLRVLFDGILSSSPVANPDFYNWNRVFLKYCDGGSFNGDVTDPKEVGLDSNSSIDDKPPVIFFRGQRIWKAIVGELLEKGMKNAQKALLSGRSAGGLATILHCDQYRDTIPNATHVKCLSDAGFFIDIPDINGVQTIEALYANVVRLQNMVGNLPKYCTSEREPTLCIFPEYIITGLKTPLFMLNTAYDTWQIDNILVPPAADPTSIWDDCRIDPSSCSDAQFRVVQDFRDSLLKKLQPLLQREKDGAFINSCYHHSQAQDGETWNGPKVDNKTIAQAVGDWYFERNLTKMIDCPFPCNPTCPHS